MLLQCLAHNAAHIGRHVKSWKIHRHNNDRFPLGLGPPETRRGGLAVVKTIHFRFRGALDDFESRFVRGDDLAT